MDIDKLISDVMTQISKCKNNQILDQIIMKIALISLFVLSLTFARTTHEQLENYTFFDYIQEFNKSYEQEEFEIRRLIFESNLEAIKLHNSNANSYKRGVNQFTDQHPQELQKLNGYKKAKSFMDRQMSNAPLFKPSGLLTLPVNFDWRHFSPNVVTPVKNQGHCGSCWTFAAAETLESHWALATGRLQNFSEQQLVSCAKNPKHCGGTGGCEGGTAQLAYQYVIDNGGIASEWTYPYWAKDQECAFDAKTTPAVAQFEGFFSIEANSYQGLIEALVQHGPIAVNVDASTWHSYESGVFDGCNVENPDVNHVVQLVGYGTDPVHGDYWTIRNSWSPTWGENGYIRIKRTGQDQLCGIDKTPQDGTICDGGPTELKVCGMCGILLDGSFPVPKIAKKFLENKQL